MQRSWGLLLLAIVLLIAGTVMANNAIGEYTEGQRTAGLVLGIAGTGVFLTWGILVAGWFVAAAIAGGRPSDPPKA